MKELYGMFVKMENDERPDTEFREEELDEVKLPLLHKTPIISAKQAKLPENITKS